ncbi:hypothetical protein MMC30_006482 [Trapelia coarctata]|nr:hypothetical protein [Trapelia coarctata]
MAFFSRVPPLLGELIEVSIPTAVTALIWEHALYHLRREYRTLEGNSRGLADEGGKFGGSYKASSVHLDADLKEDLGNFKKDPGDIPNDLGRTKTTSET